VILKSKKAILLVEDNCYSLCLVPRPHYSAQSMRFGSCGPIEFFYHSSPIRHRNELTEKAWEDAVRGLDNYSPINHRRAQRSFQGFADLYLLGAFKKDAPKNDAEELLSNLVPRVFCAAAILNKREDPGARLTTVDSRLEEHCEHLAITLR